MADDETAAAEPEHDGTDDERLSRLEDGQAEHGAALERIEQALARLVPGSHQEAQKHPPAEHRSPLKRFATHGWGA